MKPNKQFLEKVFSNKRMERYFALYPYDEDRAIKHYQSNIQLTEAFYTSLSVLGVALRNALSRELQTMANREDWYVSFADIPELSGLNKYISQASKQILARHEQVTPSKIVAELTLGFWVSLLNAEYERILWKDLRRAFPYLLKKERQRKTVSAPLNRFRAFRNRVFHNESICWNMKRVEEIHEELISILGWINKDLPEWLKDMDRFYEVSGEIKNEMGWK